MWAIAHAFEVGYSVEKVGDPLSPGTGGSGFEELWSVFNGLNPKEPLSYQGFPLCHHVVTILFNGRPEGERVYNTNIDM